MVLLSPLSASAQVDEALQKKINTAIEKGVEWLKTRQLKDGEHKGSFGDGTNPVYGGGGAMTNGGMFLASTALSLLTLLKCDVDPEDAVIKNGLAWLDAQLAREFGDVKKGRAAPGVMGGSYEAGVLMMMYEALAEARVDRKMKADGKDPKKDPRPKAELEAGEKKTVTKVKDWLVATWSRKGGWRYGAPLWDTPGGVEEDPSATQIALLGLAAAARMDVEVGELLWQKAALWLLESQEKTGPLVKKQAAGGAGGGTYAVREGDRARGWPYLRRGTKDEEKVSGSMTACGVCSLILCKAGLAKSRMWTKSLAAGVERGIWDGLAWIDAHYTVEENPNGFRSHYYYLYGLERLGTMGGYEKIGAHPWYADGAKLLVDRQRGEGKWYSGQELEPCDLIDSCFALLFLKRATVPVGVTLTR
jgi:hypothetical protein